MAFLPVLHWIDTPVGGIQEEENLGLLDSHSVSKRTYVQRMLRLSRIEKFAIYYRPFVWVND